MAGTAGNPSSSSARSGGSGSSRASQPPAKAGVEKPTGFALVPQGTHLGKAAIPLGRPVIIVGSRAGCRILLKSESVSHAHALFVKSGNTFYIRDLASRTHVFVDGRKVREHALRDGEVIKIGSFVLKFVAPAADDASHEQPSPNAGPILPATLVAAGEGMPIPIDERAMLIGRRFGSDVKLVEESVSSSHAVVFEMDGHHYIRDLGSRTGTYVNRVKIHQQRLAGDDVIRIGETTLNYKASPEALETEAVETEESATPPAEPLETPTAARPVAPSKVTQKPASAADDDFGLDLLPYHDESSEPGSVQPGAGAVAGRHAEPIFAENLAEVQTPKNETDVPSRRGWRAIAPAEPPTLATEPASPEPVAPAALVQQPVTPHPIEKKPVAKETVEKEPVETTPQAFGAPAVAPPAILPAPIAPPSMESRTNAVEEEKPEESPDDLLDFLPNDDEATHPTATARDEPLDLDLPLAPDVTGVGDEQSIAPQGIDESALNLESLASENRSSTPVADFDESHLVNADAGVADVIDFAPDWGETKIEKPLFSAAGVAEIAAAERAKALRETDDRRELERREAARISAEQAESDRVAAEQAQAQRQEAERLATEQAEAEGQEAQRALAAQIEAERIAAERAEAVRVAAEQAQVERLEAERLAVQRNESARQEADRLAAAVAQAERIATEKAEADRIEAERLEAEHLAAEQAQADRLAAEKAEADRIEAERLEAEHLAAEQAEAERLAAERAEAERIEAERQEVERLAAEQAEAERLASERAEAERAEAERLEAERLTAEQAEAERVTAEKAETERLEAERLAAEQAEAERLAAEKAEAERVEAERLETERVTAERAEAERLAAEKAEAERVEAERLESERVAAEHAEAERLATEQAEAERVAAERLESERVAAEQAEAERLAAEKAEAEHLAAEQAQAERLAAEKAETERVEAERQEADRHAAEQADREQAERQETERLASEHAREAERSSEQWTAGHFVGDAALDAAEPTAESTLDLGPIDETSAHEVSGVSDSTALPHFDADVTASPSDANSGQSIEDFTGDISGVLVEPLEPTTEQWTETHWAPPPAQSVAPEPATTEFAAPDLASEEYAPSEPPSVSDWSAPLDPIQFEAELTEPPVSDWTPAEPIVHEPSSPEPIVAEAGAPESSADELTDADLDLFGDDVEPAAGNADHDVAFPESAEAAHQNIAEEIAPAQTAALDLSKLEPGPGNPEIEPPPFDDLLPADDWEPLPTADLSLPPAPPAAANMQVRPLFPMGQTQVGGSFMPWGGNQDNYLGGQPLNLRPAEAPSSEKVASEAALPAPSGDLAPAPPQPTTARPTAPQFQQPAARFENPILPASPASPNDAEDEQIDSVSAMINDILIGEARPNHATQTPFLQASAESLRSGAERIAPPVPPQMPPVPLGLGPTPSIPTPRLLRRPMRRGLAEMERDLKRPVPLRIDELIPPFGTPLPDSGQNRRKLQESEPLDSLAKPPVHETDVFAHTSPASLEEIVSDSADSPDGDRAAAPIDAPMDEAIDDANTAGNAARRSRGGTRFPVTPGVGSPQPALGRVDLPNDPFWSGSASVARANAIAAVAGAANDDSTLPPLAEMAGALPVRGRQSLRPPSDSSRGFRQVKPVRSRTPDFEFAAAEDHSFAIAERRRRLRMIPLILLIGAILIGADLVGIWKLLPPQSTVTAHITFDRLADQDELTRKSFIRDQTDRLDGDSTRHRAIEALSKSNPEIAPGFLDDGVAYAAVTSPQPDPIQKLWPEQNRDQLVLTRSASDGEGDLTRMKSIGVAIYDSNQELLDEAERVQRNLAAAQDVIDRDTKVDEDLKNQIDEARAGYEGPRLAEKIRPLQADVEQLQKQVNDANVKLTTARAELARLQGNGSGATTAPSAAPASDDQTRQMQAQLDAVKARLDAANGARLQQAQQARAALDQTLSEFEKEVTDAKALSKDNPELTSYIAAAQTFQQTTRGLVDELMRRQQQQYAQLTDLQARLSDKMEEHRKEMWQKDPKMQDMIGSLEYDKRLFNTAVSAGDQKEVDDKKAEIALLESLIKAQQDLIPPDPFYTEAVDTIQKTLDQQQKSMQEDRESATKLLDAAQQSFAQSAPEVDKLPAEQKYLASEMEKRVADINTARAKYNDAASAIGDTTDDATRKLQDQVTSLATSIATRQQQLENSETESQRHREIADETIQVQTLTKAFDDVNAALSAKQKELQVQQAAIAASNVSGQKLDALRDQRMRVEAELQQNQGNFSFRRDAVAAAVVPRKITDADLSRKTDPDKRMAYMASTAIPIFLILSGLILWTIHAASREIPINALSPSDEGPEPFSLPSLPKAADAMELATGESNGNGSHDELESLTGAVSESESGEMTEDETATAHTVDAIGNG